jgi:hypothetical protein
MFFRRGFTNLKQLRKAELDPEASLFVRALNSSLIGFVAGAFFAPEAYQFFLYFEVAQTSVMCALVRKSEWELLGHRERGFWRRFPLLRPNNR